MPEVNDISLAQLQPVTQCRISKVRTHEPEKLRYFADLGLVPREEFELLFRAQFNGPFRIFVGQEVVPNENTLYTQTRFSGYETLYSNSWGCPRVCRTYANELFVSA